MDKTKTIPDREQRQILNREEVLQNNKRYWVGRRVQDVFLAILGILFLWPIMLIVSIVIMIDSPGAGPIFAQTRIGRDGKKFTFYKFRTMRPNAEAELEGLLPYNEMQGPVFKIKDDPRITKFGRFLRMTSIDELPQLWNILKGDMSIVGPRPGLPREVEQYDEYAKQRLLVQPGLTCLWQIQPCRNTLSFEQWLELDIQYIKERSFRLDWQIILQTFVAVLGMNGE